MARPPSNPKISGLGRVMLVLILGFLCGLLLNACVHEPDGQVYSCDPPRLIETYPENGGEDFPLDDTIIFVFEEPVDSNTVNDTTVFVIETSTGDTLIGDVFPDCEDLLPRRSTLFEKLNAKRSALGKTSPLHDTPHECGTLFIFVPEDELKPDDEYTVVITTGVTDTLGTELPDTNTWTFTTEDTIPDPPPWVDVFPEPGDSSVPLDTVITITFDDDPPGPGDTNIITLTLGPDTIPGSTVWDPVDSTMTFDPTDSLLPDTTYTVIVTIPDDCVGALCPADSTYTWTFTTEDPEEPPLPDPPGVPTSRHGSTSSFSLTDLLESDGFIRYAWNPLPEAVTYRFQLSTSPNFTTTVIDNIGIPQSTPLIYQNITASDVSVGTYYWRVNATNTGGTGAWTPVRTITVLP